MQRFRIPKPIVGQSWGLQEGFNKSIWKYLLNKVALLIASIVDLQSQIDSITPGSGSFPETATIWADERIITNGNAHTYGALTTQVYDIESYQSPPADLDESTWVFCLRAGTYTFNVLCLKNTNTGKADWYLDAAGSPFVSGQDHYAGSQVPKHVFTTTSVTVTGDGVHTLKVKVNGKNGSSSGYYLSLVKMWFSTRS